MPVDLLSDPLQAPYDKVLGGAPSSLSLWKLRVCGWQAAVWVQVIFTQHPRSHGENGQEKEEGRCEIVVALGLKLALRVLSLA